MKILVVEDSERLRRALGEGLRRSGFVVDLTGDGIEGQKFANAIDYDVIVLDIMLPGIDGLELLRDLRRRHSPAQVLILSAKDQIADRVNGLELGADDYLVKPFAFEELLARIKSLGRRRYEVNQPEIQIGELIVDTSKREVRINGSVLSLTPAEYNLLQYLCFRRGHVIAKSQLQDRLSDTGSQVVSNVIEVLVSNLRKKIGAISADAVIKTKRGFGYYVD